MNRFYLFIKNRVIGHFLANQSGSVMIAFVIMLPIIFICLAISINNAGILRARAILSEATNEASLAIVAINNQNSSPNQTNDQLATDYISYYLTKKLNNPDINQSNIEHKVVSAIKNGVTTQTDAYYISYSQEINALMRINTLQELGTSISVGNPLLTGNTRKDKLSVIESTHMSIVTDVSGSISCDYSDTNCNQYTLANSATRLSALSTALSEILTEPNVQDDITFSFIPYDIGVPVEIEQKNPAGGAAYQCSLLYKFQTINGFDFNNIDYNFWANKGLNYKRWKSLKDERVISDYITYDYQSRYKNTLFYYLDYYNYLYYSKIVGPSLNYNSDSDLEKNGLCVQSNFSESINMGATKYSCYRGKTGENYYDNYALNPNNATKINQQYGPLVWLYDHMYSTTEFNNINYSFANIDTVDVYGTKNELFSNMDKLTINFTRPIEPAMPLFTPFMAMCQSPLYANGVLVNNNDNIDEVEDAYLNASSALQHFSTKNSPTLQEDKTAAELLNYFNNHLTSGSANTGIGGGTDTITAVLRTVPILAKESSKTKVMVIISDGKDDGDNQGYSADGMAIGGAAALRDLFLTETQSGSNKMGSICRVIEEGLTSKSNYEKGYIENVADRVSIHFIKLDPNADNLLNSTDATDDDYRAVYGKWFDCIGKKENFHSVNNLSLLKDALVKIFEMETGVFIKNRD